MALILVQTDTVAPCGTILACTSPADGLATVPQARQAEEDGSVGSGELSVTINKADIQAGVMFESPGIGQTTWQSGTYTVRLNVTTAVANLNLIEVHICRVNSSCVSQEIVGSSVGLGISMGTIGVKNVDVIGSEQSANVTDRIYIVFIFHAVNHTNPIFGFTPDQNIDTSIEEAQEFIYAGDIPVIVLPDEPKALLSKSYLGDVPLSALPSYASILDRVYAGTIPLAVLSDAPVAPLEKSYGGEILLTMLPDFPKAILEKSYAGAIAFALVPNSTYGLFGANEFIYAGDIPLTALPSYVSVVDRVYQGAIPLALMPNSIYSLEEILQEFVYGGDIPLFVLSGYSSMLEKTYKGDVAVVLAPSSLCLLEEQVGVFLRAKRPGMIYTRKPSSFYSKTPRSATTKSMRKG